MILPAWTPLNTLLTVLYGLLLLSMPVGEASGWLTMKYSKFFQSGNGIPSRVGMFWLYFIPFGSGLLFSLPVFISGKPLGALLCGMILLHFGKRWLEALFLHKYSGKINLFNLLAIMAFYSLVAGGLCYLSQWPAASPAEPNTATGLGLFVLGISGNLYHHQLLAQLRRPPTGYAIPRGGLFEYVVCPHYLFEIITWLGMALVAQHLFAWMSLLGMTGYLVARSHKTLQWYRATFPNFPAARKALLPFLF